MFCHEKKWRSTRPEADQSSFLLRNGTAIASSVRSATEDYCTWFWAASSRVSRPKEEELVRCVESDPTRRAPQGQCQCGSSHLTHNAEAKAPCAPQSDFFLVQRVSSPSSCSPWRQRGRVRARVFPNSPIHRGNRESAQVDSTRARSLSHRSTDSFPIYPKEGGCPFLVSRGKGERRRATATRKAEMHKTALRTALRTII
jgi:hypothetical protein